MAQRNYKFEKRQKDLAKQKKKDEKKQRKLLNKQETDEFGNEINSADEDSVEDTPAQDETPPAD